MDNFQVDTRHTELSYWSSIDEVYNKKLTVKHLKGFSYQSSFEIDFLSKTEFSEETIPFYVFLDELKKIYSYIMRKSSYLSDTSNAKDRLLLVLRISVLGYVAKDACGTIFRHLEELLQGQQEQGLIKGLKSLVTITTVSKTVVERLDKELYFEDPGFFIKDIYGSISHAMSISSFSKAIESLDIFIELIEALESEGVFYSFYDFSGELRKRLIVPNLSASTNDKQVVFFENGPFWLSNELDGSVYSLVFCVNPRIEKTVKFIEILRLYYSQKTQSIDSSRAMLLSEIAKKLIDSGDEKVGSLTIPTAVIGGYSNDEVKVFLARSYNTHIINRRREDVEKIIERELSSHKKQLYTADMQSAIEIHRVAFASIIEKVSAFFIQNQTSGLIHYRQDHFKNETYVHMLAEIMKNAYTQFIAGDKR